MNNNHLRSGAATTPSNSAKDAGGLSSATPAASSTTQQQPNREGTFGQAAQESMQSLVAAAATSNQLTGFNAPTADGSASARNLMLHSPMVHSSVAHTTKSGPSQMAYVQIVKDSKATGQQLSANELDSIGKQLEQCATQGDADEMQEILFKHQDVIQKKFLNVALRAAVKGCTTQKLEYSIQCTQLLIEAGANINSEEPNEGKTALMMSCEKGYLELVKKLLDNQALINHKDQQKRTSLMYAIGANAQNVDVVEELLNEGADVNDQTLLGLTPLLLATKKSHSRICKLLLSKGADIAAQNREDLNSCLHYACIQGNILTLNTLLEHCRQKLSDQMTRELLHLLNKNSKTALQIANEKHTESPDDKTREQIYRKMDLLYEETEKAVDEIVETLTSVDVSQSQTNIVPQVGNNKDSSGLGGAGKRSGAGSGATTRQNQQKTKKQTATAASAATNLASSAGLRTSQGYSEEETKGPAPASEPTKSTSDNKFNANSAAGTNSRDAPKDVASRKQQQSAQVTNVDGDSSSCDQVASRNNASDKFTVKAELESTGSVAGTQTQHAIKSKTTKQPKKAKKGSKSTSQANSGTQLPNSSASFAEIVQAAYSQNQQANTNKSGSNVNQPDQTAHSAASSPKATSNDDDYDEFQSAESRTPPSQKAGEQPSSATVRPVVKQSSSKQPSSQHGYQDGGSKSCKEYVRLPNERNENGDGDDDDTVTEHSSSDGDHFVDTRSSPAQLLAAQQQQILITNNSPSIAATASSKAQSTGITGQSSPNAVKLPQQQQQQPLTKAQKKKKKLEEQVLAASAQAQSKTPQVALKLHVTRCENKSNSAAGTHGRGQRDDCRFPSTQSEPLNADGVKTQLSNSYSGSSPSCHALPACVRSQPEDDHRHQTPQPGNNIASSATHPTQQAHQQASAANSRQPNQQRQLAGKETHAKQTTSNLEQQPRSGKTSSLPQQDTSSLPPWMQQPAPVAKKNQSSASSSNASQGAVQKAIVQTTPQPAPVQAAAEKTSGNGWPQVLIEQLSAAQNASREASQGSGNLASSIKSSRGDSETGSSSLHNQTGKSNNNIKNRTSNTTLKNSSATAAQQSEKEPRKQSDSQSSATASAPRHQQQQPKQSCDTTHATTSSTTRKQNAAVVENLQPLSSSSSSAAQLQQQALSQGKDKSQARTREQMDNTSQSQSVDQNSTGGGNTTHAGSGAKANASSNVSVAASSPAAQPQNESANRAAAGGSYPQTFGAGGLPQFGSGGNASSDPSSAAAQTVNNAQLLGDNIGQSMSGFQSSKYQQQVTPSAGFTEPSNTGFYMDTGSQGGQPITIYKSLDTRKQQFDFILEQQEMRNKMLTFQLYSHKERMREIELDVRQRKQDHIVRVNEYYNQAQRYYENFRQLETEMNELAEKNEETLKGSLSLIKQLQESTLVGSKSSETQQIIQQIEKNLLQMETTNKKFTDEMDFRKEDEKSYIQSQNDKRKKQEQSLEEQTNLQNDMALMKESKANKQSVAKTQIQYNNLFIEMENTFGEESEQSLYQQSSRYPQQVFNKLHDEIILFDESVKSIMDEIEPIKKIIIDKISSFIKLVIPNGDVEVYGSHATKLCLHWSDIDLVLKPASKDGNSGGHRGADDHHPQPHIYSNSRGNSDGMLGGSSHGVTNMRNWLNILYSELIKSENRNWLQKVDFIENTTVPVIKLACSFHHLSQNANGQLLLPNGLVPRYPAIVSKAINVDITLWSENHNGLPCVQLVKSYLAESQLIEPLILVLKQMLKVWGFNDAYTGGLSSYALFLMIVSFLQEKRKPALKSEVNLGETLLELIRYYAQLDFSQYAICCKRPGDQSDKPNTYQNNNTEYNFFMQPRFVIDDPLMASNNVGKSAFRFQEIKNIMSHAYNSVFTGCFCSCHFKSMCCNTNIQQNPFTYHKSQLLSSFSSYHGPQLPQAPNYLSYQHPPSNLSYASFRQNTGYQPAMNQTIPAFGSSRGLTTQWLPTESGSGLDTSSDPQSNSAALGSSFQPQSSLNSTRAPNPAGGMTPQLRTQSQPFQIGASRAGGGISDPTQASQLPASWQSQNQFFNQNILQPHQQTYDADVQCSCDSILSRLIYGYNNYRRTMESLHPNFVAMNMGPNSFNSNQPAGIGPGGFGLAISQMPFMGGQNM